MTRDDAQSTVDGKGQRPMTTEWNGEEDTSRSDRAKEAKDGDSDMSVST